MRARVVRTSLPWRDPEAVVQSLAATGDVVWFDAGVDASAGRSVIGWGDAVTGRRSAARSGELALDEAWRLLERELATPVPGSDPLGFAGWLGYGVGRWLLDREIGAGATETEVARGADAAPPDLGVLRLDRALVFDHATRSVTSVHRGQAAWAAGLAHAWPGIGARSDDVQPPMPSAAPRWAHTDDGYLDLIARCQAAIAAGEAYQLCLTTTVDVPGDVDGLEAYRRLRRSSPAPHASFVRVGTTAVLGASPESFLEIAPDGTISSSPIKGTRRRGAGPEDDARLIDELRHDEKERAENLMIVDLVRNDLTRVCRLGSVEVTELLAVHSFAHVHQLVSTVRGRLSPGRSAIDAVSSCFPAGSMTGAPKRRAVDLLGAWEGRPRGVYAGTVGRLGFDGSADLAMAIRSIVVTPGGASIGAGGGITASSRPLDELAEVGLKAAALLRVVGAG